MPRVSVVVACLKKALIDKCPWVSNIGQNLKPFSGNLDDPYEWKILECDINILANKTNKHLPCVLYQMQKITNSKDSIKVKFPYRVTF